MIRKALENNLRQKKKTILNLLICGVTVILLNAYMGNIAEIRKQLSKLPEVVEVDAVISNLNGTLSSGLKIKESYIDGVLNSEYVTDPVFTVQLKIGFGAFGREDWQERLTYDAEGVTAAYDVPGFSQGERVCLIDGNIAKEQGIKPGDEITVTAAYYRYGDGHEIFMEPLETGKYMVAGFLDTEDFGGAAESPDVVFPFETVREIFHEKNLEFFADSGTFQVKDPYQLNEFKQEMKNLQFMQVIPAAEYRYEGDALTVLDETFIRSAEQLLRNEELFTGMFPFLAIAVLCIGYVTASLLMRGRREEYAIMRSLGQSYGHCFLSLCLEYGLAALAGCLAGTVCSRLFWGSAGETMFYVAAAFMCCYVLGEAAALWSVKRWSVMAVLCKND